MISGTVEVAFGKNREDKKGPLLNIINKETNQLSSLDSSLERIMDDISEGADPELFFALKEELEEIARVTGRVTARFGAVLSERNGTDTAPDIEDDFQWSEETRYELTAHPVQSTIGKLNAINNELANVESKIMSICDLKALFDGSMDESAENDIAGIYQNALALNAKANSLLDMLVGLKRSFCVPHQPILIDGNSEFTFANGVTGGSGTVNDPYVIQGWDIDASTAHGIEIRNTDAHFVIRNVCVHSGINVFDINYNGIFINNAGYGIIESSTIWDNVYGIYLKDSAFIQIISNRVYKNSYSGIILFKSALVTIENNTVTSNFGSGITISESAGVLVIDNFVEDNVGSGIISGSSTYLTIYNNVAHSNRQAGITIGTNSAHIKVENNIVTKNGYWYTGAHGISSISSSYVEILDNIVLQNGRGGINVGLESTKILVKGNIVKHNGGIQSTGSGIITGKSTNVDIVDNFIAKNYAVGILIGNGSSNVYVIGNNITNNSGGDTVYGIHVSGSTDVWIYCNIIHEHGLYEQEIIISYTGIILDTTSANVKVYHNNYIRNSLPKDLGTNNQWDNGYPSGGNYWWDIGGYYTGPDPSMDTHSGPNQDIPGSDGIVDFSKTIVKFGEDRYPLMEQVNITKCLLAYGLLSYPVVIKNHMRICTNSLAHLNTKIERIFDSGNQRTEGSILDTLQTINYEAVGIVNSITLKLQDDYIISRSNISRNELINFNIDSSAVNRLKTVENKIIQISADVQVILEGITDRPDENTQAALRALRDAAAGIVGWRFIINPDVPA